MTELEIYERMDELENEFNDLKAELKKLQEQKLWRAEENEVYYCLDIDTFEVDKVSEDHVCSDNDRYEVGNYFKTEERAEEVAEKIRFLLKLERYHDLYCPDYKPDWNGKLLEMANRIWVVYFEVPKEKFVATNCIGRDNIHYVYFPTQEIAQKVADRLNEELNG